MSNKIKQSNILGDNLFKSKKFVSNKYRAQGFIAGIVVSIIAAFIYDYFKG